MRREGGCSCGAVRYRVQGEPRVVSHCHCDHCRRASGAAFVTWAEFASEQYRLLQGSPRTHRSKPSVCREFCPACGTQLTYRDERNAEHLDVTVCSLDDPETLRPVDHLWCERMLGWVTAADALPRHPFRRGSRESE